MAKNNVKMNDPKLREDIASFKASFAFIIFCLIIFLTASNAPSTREGMMKLYKFRDYLDNNMWLLIIPFGIFAISAFMRIRAGINKTDESYRYFSTHDFLGLSSLFVVYTLTFAATNNILMYSIVVVGFAVGYYAKRFFGVDFYTVTILNLAIAFGLWIKFGNKGWDTTLSNTALILLMLGVAAAIILIVVFTVSRIIHKNKSAGQLDKTLCIFGVDGKSADFSKLCLFPVFVSIVIGAVLAATLYFFPAYLTLLVAEIILLIQYVVLGVFYTVKLINQ